MPNLIDDDSARLRSAIQAACVCLVDRDALVELVVLAAVAREHVLVVGPAGTGKSQAVRRVAEQLHGKYFEYLVGRFTEPTDIFGTVDLARLREGKVEIQTRGMLPEAEIAFLDEVFLGSPAILNTLLGILNERVFVRGHTRLECPLRLCVGASNEIPDEPMLAAFGDRFLVRIFVEPVADAMLETLLEEGSKPCLPTTVHGNMQLLEGLAKRAEGFDLTAVRVHLAPAIRALRNVGVVLTDRRIVRVQRLVAAAAALRGADQPSVQDLWPIVYAIPTAEQQALGRDVLREVLDQAANPTLPKAAESASGSSSARALRLAREIDSLLTDADGRDWAHRAEAILREITASFDDELRPEALKQAQTRLLTRLQA